MSDDIISNFTDDWIQYEPDELLEHLCAFQQVPVSLCSCYAKHGTLPDRPSHIQILDVYQNDSNILLAGYDDVADN